MLSKRFSTVTNEARETVDEFVNDSEFEKRKFCESCWYAHNSISYISFWPAPRKKEVATVFAVYTILIR